MGEPSSKKKSKQAEANVEIKLPKYGKESSSSEDLPAANVAISAPRTGTSRIKLPVKNQATRAAPSLKIEPKVPEFKAEVKVDGDLRVSKGKADMKKVRKRSSSSSSSSSN